MSDNNQLNLSTKEIFNDEVLERINNGTWGLKNIKFLQVHKEDYNLTYEDINLYILHIYRYTYNMAMLDGELQPDEIVYLNNIKRLYNHNNPPKNFQDVKAMKSHINALTQNFKHNQTIKNTNNSKYDLEEEHKLEEESNKVYKKPLPKYPRPKLTPYNSASFWG